jgi:hypothetical protein
MQDSSTRRRSLFLRVYGAVSLALFSELLLGFIVQWAALDEGAPLHWVST